MQEAEDDILPDVLAVGLDVVFCGSAVGTRSARAGAHYAGPGNRFWPTLFSIGLMPEQIRPANFRHVVRYGIGLTDLAKKASGSDASLSTSDYDGPSLRIKIEANALVYSLLTASERPLYFCNVRFSMVCSQRELIPRRFTFFRLRRVLRVASGVINRGLRWQSGWRVRSILRRGALCPRI